MLNAPLKIAEKSRNMWEVDACFFIIVSNHFAVYYIYICMCVCVCVRGGPKNSRNC